MPYWTATSLLRKHKPMTIMKLMFDQWKFFFNKKNITSNGVHPPTYSMATLSDNNSFNKNLHETRLLIKDFNKNSFEICGALQRNKNILLQYLPILLTNSP
jgi:hypothetical protein